MADQKTTRALFTYTIGFLLSAILSLVAYVLVTNTALGGGVVLALLISCLAVVQAAVQLVCFLHIASEKRPRWNLYILLATIGILAIIVGGSMWIMTSLNYNMMMTPEEMTEFMQEQNKKGF